jgi:predicted DNA-binding transcriptional regulator YafY
MPQSTTRVLTILELLQTHGRMSGSDLAQRLNVDSRTLRRYIISLEDLGVPITTERGRYGGYSLVSGFKLPPMMFTSAEAMALALGLVAVRGIGIAEAASAVASAQAKLERVMPANLKRRVRAAVESIAFDFARPGAPVASAALAVMTEAAQTSQRIHMRYRAARGEASEREFDTYGLAYRTGHWYAIGWCHARGSIRSFRVDRVESARLLDMSFTRPAGFDALGYLVSSLATIPRKYPFEVVLATDLATAQSVLMRDAGALEPVLDGVLLRAQTDDLQFIARELARLPFAFRVREPAALRDAVRACAERLLLAARE